MQPQHLVGGRSLASCGVRKSLPEEVVFQLRGEGCFLGEVKERSSQREHMCNLGARGWCIQNLWHLAHPGNSGRGDRSWLRSHEEVWILS